MPKIKDRGPSIVVDQIGDDYLKVPLFRSSHGGSVHSMPDVLSGPRGSAEGSGAEVRRISSPATMNSGPAYCLATPEGKSLRVPIILEGPSKSTSQISLVSSLVDLSTEGEALENAITNRDLANLRRILHRNRKFLDLRSFSTLDVEDDNLSQAAHTVTHPILHFPTAPAPSGGGGGGGGGAGGVSTGQSGPDSTPTPTPTPTVILPPLAVAEEVSIRGGACAPYFSLSACSSRLSSRQASVADVAESCAVIDNRTRAFSNALHLAVRHNAVECLAVLLRHGFDPNRAGLPPPRRTPFLAEVAARLDAQGYPAFVFEALDTQKGTSVDSMEDQNSPQTPTFQFTYEAFTKARRLLSLDDRIKLLRELLTAPANMYYEDHLLGCPPILLAVFLGNKESSIALLKLRASPRVTDCLGNTALHLCFLRPRSQTPQPESPNTGYTTTGAQGPTGGGGPSTASSGGGASGGSSGAGGGGGGGAGGGGTPNATSGTAVSPGHYFGSGQHPWRSLLLHGSSITTPNCLGVTPEDLWPDLRTELQNLIASLLSPHGMSGTTRRIKSGKFSFKPMDRRLRKSGRGVARSGAASGSAAAKTEWRHKESLAKSDSSTVISVECERTSSISSFKGKDVSAERFFSLIVLECSGKSFSV